MTIKELYEGKATTIKGIDYQSTKFYTEPFINKIQPLCKNIIINVIEAEQTSKTEGKPDVVYNKVLIQGVLKESFMKGYDKVISMTYALNVKDPVCKIYVCAMNQFGDIIQTDKDCIIYQKIENKALNFNNIDALLERESVLEKMIEQMSNVSLTKTEIQQSLGKWVDFSLRVPFINDHVTVKLAKAMPICAYQMFINKNSEFYVEDSLDMLSCYFAFAKLITDDKKDFVNKFEKTILISKMFGL